MGKSTVLFVVMIDLHEISYMSGSCSINLTDVGNEFLKPSGHVKFYCRQFTVQWNDREILHPVTLSRLALSGPLSTPEQQEMAAISKYCEREVAELKYNGGKINTGATVILTKALNINNDIKSGKAKIHTPLLGNPFGTGDFIIMMGFLQEVHQLTQRADAFCPYSAENTKHVYTFEKCENDHKKLDWMSIFSDKSAAHMEKWQLSVKPVTTWLGQLGSEVRQNLSDFFSGLCCERTAAVRVYQQVCIPSNMPFSEMASIVSQIPDGCLMMITLFSRQEGNTIRYPSITAHKLLGDLCLVPLVEIHKLSLSKTIQPNFYLRLIEADQLFQLYQGVSRLIPSENREKIRQQMKQAMVTEVVKELEMLDYQETEEKLISLKPFTQSEEGEQKHDYFFIQWIDPLF